ncbi:MAG: TIGR01777 family oxidoreductase [Planctomycetaceae bacterium]|nr:TIGR01777 family oxidoreductase [Planctomycetaceae bacterium]
MSDATSTVAADTTSTAIESVAITGATGLVGTALSELLAGEGKSVAAISRRDGGSYQDTIKWDPATGLTNPARLDGVDAVVHLAGENIAGARWNDSVKRKILNSRVEGTRSLVKSIAAVENRPRVLVSASAIGIYGDRGDEQLTEDSAAGEGFLADVCRAWEEEANAAKDLGLRVVNVRIGVVLSPKGGALAKMLLPFKMGMGGIVGSGKQYWSWIGLHDLTRVIAYCVNNDSVEGPVNAVSPEPLTNRAFTKDVGRVLKRPTIFPLPGFMAKLVLGEMAQDLLLASARVLPNRLQAAGFEFSHPQLQDCLRHELNT